MNQLSENLNSQTGTASGGDTNSAASLNQQTILQEKFTILLVDDLKENLISLEDMLQAENRVFLKANNGLEALKIVLKNPEIGLILLDVQMPEMDGYEVAKLLNSNPKTRNIPFLFVTANQIQDQNILEGFKKGAVDYLVKPLNITITRAKVAVFENLYFKELKLRNIIIERNQVNAQLERYTKVMAHDLKTPLAGITSLISLIQMNEEVQLINDVQEDLQLLSTLSSNLSEMITKVLEDSMKADDEVTDVEVSIEHLVSKCITLLQAPPSIRFKIDNELPIFKTRPTKLQQIFQNLIGNAIKYNDKPQGLISIGSMDQGEFIKFYIKDNGPGIDPEDTLRIFEIFETSNAKSKIDSSTGLGLHFVKTILEEQGGKIWVESIPRQGSCFYFLWKK